MRSRAAVTTSVVVVAALAAAGAASAKPIVMPTVTKEFQTQQAALAHAQAGGITPPAPPCPENGVLYPPPVAPPSGVPYLLGNCGVAQPAATSTPWPGNMAYYGGHVQVHPKEYMVYWGWGQSGAFPSSQNAPPRRSPRARSLQRSGAIPTAPASTWPTSSSRWAAPAGRT